MATAFRKKILSNFKLQGLHLHNEAMTFLVEVLDPYSDREDINDILDQIVEAVKRQPLKVGRKVMEVAVEECNQASDLDARTSLKVLKIAKSWTNLTNIHTTAVLFLFHNPYRHI